MIRPIILAVAALAVATSCTTSPLGRSQINMVSDREANRLGNFVFAETKNQTTRSWDPKQIRYVNCIANAIIDVVGDTPTAPSGWDVVVFDQEDINAFAIAGGNIGVFTGIMTVAETQDQLAAVMAHEVAHVTSRHLNERMSTQRVTGLGGAVAGAAIGVGNAQVLTNLALNLPFNRAQENEADLLGLDYMAQAGFDPRAAVQLWENMREKNPGSPPQFLSTHPSSLSRIDALQNRMPRAMELYEQARKEGKNPQCE